MTQREPRENRDAHLDILRHQLRALELERERMRALALDLPPKVSAWRRPVPWSQVMGLIAFGTSLAAIVLGLRIWLIEMPLHAAGSTNDSGGPVAEPSTPDDLDPQHEPPAPPADDPLATTVPTQLPASPLPTVGGRPPRPPRPDVSDGLPHIDFGSNDPLGGLPLDKRNRL
jgi:hypothetical protein